MNAIKVLDVSASNISDENLKVVSKLNTLEYLDLSQTAITNDGLRNLVCIFLFPDHLHFDLICT
jgi:hypothetical protein